MPTMTLRFLLLPLLLLLGACGPDDSGQATDAAADAGTTATPAPPASPEPATGPASGSDAHRTGTARAAPEPKQRRQSDPFVVEEPWIRAAAPGASVLAGYARLRNTGSQTLVVRPCASPGFSRVELHRTRHRDGVAQMRPMDELAIPAASTANLVPGSIHLMLMQPATVPPPGAEVLVCLEVNGLTRDVPFRVLGDVPG